MIIRICMDCKKILGRVEGEITTPCFVHFSHGICEKCEQARERSFDNDNRRS